MNENNFNIDYEISNLIETLSLKKIISTIDIAKIFNICDKYIKIGLE